MLRKLLLIGISALISLNVQAETYRLNVTRDDSNLYEANGGSLIINTQYCYEYIYNEDSLLKADGYFSEIIFLDSGTKCDVKAVYKSVSQPAGDYVITVSYEDDNWYKVWVQDLYIKTSVCLSLVVGEDAILSLHSEGFGTLYIGGDECMVEGVYSKIRV